MKKLAAITIAALILLSACGKSTPPLGAETTTKYSSEAETTAETTAELTEEEVNDLIESMPEIVFVMSHDYYPYSTRGFYILNSGEIKIFDFYTIEPGGEFDIREHYDELKEVTHEELMFFPYWGAEPEFMKTVDLSDIPPIPQDELAGFYQTLLLFDAKNEYRAPAVNIPVPTMDTGTYKIYGIRTDQNGGNEIILFYQVNNLNPPRILDPYGLANQLLKIPPFNWSLSSGSFPTKRSTR
ncbi:MAG: hypothetical protein FWG90_12395 [Oscillospiraceae bacterium]|nr:hypothetical protein [Oscillospiraceae bacterium]